MRLTRCTRIHSGPRLYIGGRLDNDVPERTRTSDPRFRKRGFGVLSGCTAVQGRSRRCTGMHRTGARRFLNGEEPACTGVERKLSGETVTGE